MTNNPQKTLFHKNDNIILFIFSLSHRNNNNSHSNFILHNLHHYYNTISQYLIKHVLNIITQQYQITILLISNQQQITNKVLTGLCNVILYNPHSNNNMKAPTERHTLNREQLIRAITLTLDQILNSSSTQIQYQKTHFHGAIPPAVTIDEYLKRIDKYAYCSDSVYIMTLVYIDKLQERNPDFVLNRFSIHRTIITAFMVAAKFYDDFYFKNNYYAKIGGINKNEINNLEVTFLEMVNYDLFVPPELFQMYSQKLLCYSAVNP